jgi:NADP-dependent 3-hydroxy acid dehydrogenase YdfG
MKPVAHAATGPGDAELPPLVFITGASSGIGQALAGHYAQAGWRLALVARRAGVLQD